MKKIIDEFGEEKIVDDDLKKFYSYSNKKQEITWNAPIMEDGKATGQWTNYKEKGTVDDIDLRLETWNNMVKLQYMCAVHFDVKKNDPDKEMWHRVVEAIKKKPEDCFDKYGDFKKDLLVDVSKFK